MFEGHQGPVTGISCHSAVGTVDFSHLFITSSFDWTVKLWSTKVWCVCVFICVCKTERGCGGGLIVDSGEVVECVCVRVCVSHRENELVSGGGLSAVGEQLLGKSSLSLTTCMHLCVCVSENELGNI